MIWVFIAVVIVGLIFIIVYNARSSKPAAKKGKAGKEEVQAPDTASDNLGQPAASAAADADAFRSDNASAGQREAGSAGQYEAEATAGRLADAPSAASASGESHADTGSGGQGYQAPKRNRTPSSVKLVRDNDFRSSLRQLSNQENEDLHEKMKTDDAYRDALRSLNHQAASRRKE
ncbi:hypothetical protein [Paenibacillus protaetiae]|uniref:Uncharacterized protein n=1 Tax=Paenibacillus protaetiae TaxID=2509456 RepID=A0A4P6EWX9_9BACL|nr:hypothetical protein [Paenibacillus protaetiae]QAY67900.1 hypothetical protein ET464_17435 [Paenibacillus protaetiae]